ncbi:malonyl-CoA decarboxylase, mitochondrial isoform X2 [Neltuma alba]|uniref:malonyl-CoA decarboxylase, mitochondrial isoform X2 n=1 Tax=Neltuma alba TaxID=207710 RepID=UPI0010A3289A|nr:malonyl-CoA decarboxylase, mitochondrial-like isoform X2 [Prosopis alba]
MRKLDSTDNLIPLINMNKKALAILMRARMRSNNSINPSLSPLARDLNQMKQNSPENQSAGHAIRHDSESKMRTDDAGNCEREFELVRTSMHSAISMSKTEDLDTALDNFSEGYANLYIENRRKLLLVLAREYDLNRVHVRELIKQYLGLELPSVDKAQGNFSEEGLFSSFYRIERNLRHALRPLYEILFDRLNTHPGGLRFLSILRSDILSILTEENISSLRALDSYLKEKLSTWLSPATLELHQITWDDPASLLEKIVAYEAVHPISNLLDLKRRLGVGRRCFGYLHPAIPGEPLIFIEVALLKNVARTIQEVLWDSPPIPESEATCALFYSISSTQPGLSGINLGEFLIKRVITLVKREMPHISTFATLSPIPGFMQWLLSKLASQTILAESDTSESLAEGSSSTFRENILKPEEEKALMSISKDIATGKNGMEVMFNLLTSTDLEWTKSPELLCVLQPLLMRLCARYLLQEKKRGKALDSVANFHLQNGAMIERINWMADRSEKGLSQSGGIMVNYVYRLEHINEFAHSYFSTGDIHASSDLRCAEYGGNVSFQGWFNCIQV